MNQDRFAALTRLHAGRLARRGLLRAPVVAFLLAGGGRSAPASAKKKKRKKKLVRNEFGCVDVGNACRGNDANCCSGICDGATPKKGKKDQSRCVAHNTGECLADQDSCVGKRKPCGPLGAGDCLRTTGKASFCGRTEGSGECTDCKTDADCIAEFGPGSACVVCGFCDENGGTTCFPPGDRGE